MVKAGWQSHSS